MSFFDDLRLAITTFAKKTGPLALVNAKTTGKFSETAPIGTLLANFPILGWKP
jgi:hypothetical protein